MQQPTRLPTGLVYDDRFLLHDPKHSMRFDNEVEVPARVEAIMSALTTHGLAQRMVPIPSQFASDGDLELVHSKRHIQRVKSLGDAQVRRTLVQELFTKSLFASEGTVEASLLSAGSTVHALEMMSRGEIGSALCVVRPPGHHSEREEMHGFCFFDNVAVAASAAVTRLGYERVAVVDWDVHHGNGIQNSFYSSSEVLYVSIHRSDYGKFYPAGEEGGPHRVGQGPGAGYNINVAWNGREGPFGDEEYAHAFEKVVLPALREFNPQVVLVAAGFDASLGDPLGRCKVSPDGFAWMLRQLCDVSYDSRVCVVLEGGYELHSLSSGMVRCAQVLLGDDDGAPRWRSTASSSSPSRDAVRAVSVTRERHGEVASAFSQRWTTTTTCGALAPPPAKRVEFSVLPAGAPACAAAFAEEGAFLRECVVAPSLQQPRPGAYDKCMVCKAAAQDENNNNTHCVAPPPTTMVVCIKCYGAFCFKHAHGHAVCQQHHVRGVRMDTVSLCNLLDVSSPSSSFSSSRLRPIMSHLHEYKFGVPLPDPVFPRSLHPQPFV